MENIEIMNEGMDTMFEEVVGDEVVAMAPGMGKYAKGGLILAAVAAGAVLAKKAYDAYKAKKELREPDHEIEVEPEDIEAVVKPEE
jgi:uncharacterized membrane protein YebE (DUF533 family)